jgi:hypothetical protein
MASAPSKQAHVPAPMDKSGARSGDSRLLKAFDALFRFLASLKLAVFSIACLAGVLAYATFYESWYGTGAVQESIYKSPGFAVLLTFLGMNILCAALIRYPWTKRQTGFVITHAGLLVVLLGSWVSFKVTDDGQVAITEGEESSQLARMDHTVVRVQSLDAEGRAEKEYQLPFHCGSFPWENDRRAVEAAHTPAGASTAASVAAGVFGVALVGLALVWITTGRTLIKPLFGSIAAATLAVLGLVSWSAAQSYAGPRVDVLTDEREPFEIKVKEFYPASSTPKFSPIAGKGGVPMIKATVLLKPPRADREVDVLADPARGVRPWLIAANPRFRRAARDLRAALVTFQYVETPEQVEDFLELPKDPMKNEQARIHYKDKAGRASVYVWDLDEKSIGKSVTLPDSDLEVTFAKTGEIPLGDDTHAADSMMAAIGEAEIHIAEFNVKKGADAPVQHYGWASLPLIPSVIPTKANPDGKELVHIAYFRPPHISQVALQGRSGQLDVLGTADGKLYYRAFGREGLRGKGSIEKGKLVRIVSGPNQPVALSLRVDEYFTSGVDREVCEPLVLPKGQMGNGIPAALVEMTAQGETKEFWARRSADFRQQWKDVTFPSGSYRVALDFDRKPLDFSVKLVDFDEGKDPGSSQSKSFVSKVLLNDASRKIVDEPVTISMNRPMSHKAYTFYQTNFIHLEDPRTLERTGDIMSVFAVRYDPVWTIIYGGCLLVVIGTFVQFYMRAGVFTDGGKKERERAAAKTARAKQSGSAAAPATNGSVASKTNIAEFEEL